MRGPVHKITVVRTSRCESGEGWTRETLRCDSWSKGKNNERQAEKKRSETRQWSKIRRRVRMGGRESTVPESLVGGEGEVLLLTLVDLRCGCEISRYRACRREKLLMGG